MLLEAPTGIGKSGIAVGLGRLIEKWKLAENGDTVKAPTRTMILVHTKQLQEQYLQFEGVREVKGRGNFPCLVDPDLTAADGECVYGIECAAKADCPYYVQKHQALGADVVVSNYAYWLREANGLGGFGDLDLLVLDEAHLADDALRSVVSTDLTEHALGRFIRDYGPIPRLGSEIGAWIAWAEHWVGPAMTDAAQLQRKVRANPWDRRLKAELRQRKALERSLLALSGADESWVVTPQRHGPGLKFQPAWTAGFAPGWIFRHARRVILQSATILDPAIFVEMLGLDPDEVEFVGLGSPFRPEIRPIVYRPAMRVRHGVDPEPLVLAVRSVVDGHPNEKGLIHAQSYTLARRIIEGVDSRRLIGHDGRDRIQVLSQFKASLEPLVLVSPSMTTGVDLPYDQLRFQVIAKLPFPDRSDPQVKRRLEFGPDGTPGSEAGDRWYAWATACALIQAAGRGVRAADDFAVTYILDGSLTWFTKIHKHLIPGWFREAWV